MPAQLEIAEDTAAGAHADPAPRPGAAEWTAIAIVGILFVSCLVWLMWKTGVTVDEPSHFLSGRLYWEGRDNLRPGDMPPLIKIVSGWAPLAMRAPLPPPEVEAWATRDEWALSMNLMERMSAEETRRYFFAARLPMLIFPLGCLLLIWWWGRCLFPPWAAVAAATVFCLSPTVLGHGALLKNDLAASFAYLLFWYRAWRYWRAPGWRNGAWLGAGLLCAILAKYSLTVLAPVAAAILVARCLRAPRQKPREAARAAAACALVVWIGMLAAWQFRLEPLTFTEFQAWKANPDLPRLAVKAIRVASHVPLPGAFWRGGVSLISSNHFGAVYLLGKVAPGGSLLYFPIALAVKVPLVTQLLIAISLGLLVAQAWRRTLPSGAWCWILPGFLYLGLASLSGLQLGVRLVLPALVFFVLLTGKAFELGRARRGVRIACMALIGLLAVRAAMAAPNYISYFNFWVGDSWRGLRILSDSNIDWGQDLRSLREWYDRSGVRHFTLSYFGAENVYAYFNDHEVECVRPPWSAETALGRTRMALAPGYYAISATLISGQFFQPEYRDYYAAFRSMQPVARAGQSIFIYRLGR